MNVITNTPWQMDSSNLSPNSYDRRKRRFDEGEALVKQYSGSLASSFKGFNGTFNIKCQHNYGFTLKLSELRKGIWCPHCKDNNPNKWYIVTKEKVEAKGGRMISPPSAYENAHSKLTIQCNNGHQFDVTCNNLKNGKWCPTCKLHTGEAITIQAAERLTGRKFVKVRPDWLKYIRNLELDGYCEVLKLAIEYQGKQHYTYMPNIHRTEETFKDAQKRDEFKREQCMKHGIKLIEVPYTVAHANIPTYLEDQFKRNGIPMIVSKVQVDYDAVVRAVENREKINQVCANKGGHLLTLGAIPNGDYNVTIECSKGHKFISKYKCIMRGSWCSVCSHQMTRETATKISTSLKEHYKCSPRPFIAKGRTPRDPNLAEKACKGPCGLMRPISLYNKKEDTADGFQPWCRECVNEAKAKSKAKLKSDKVAFICTHCGKQYTVKDSLTRHIKAKHKQTTISEQV